MGRDISIEPEFAFFNRDAELSDAYCRELGVEFNSSSNSAVQQAVQEIASLAFSEIFAIRELLKLHYLHPAEILLRPLLEKLATISYLRKEGSSAVSLWASNWERGRKRPTANERIKRLDDVKSPFTGAPFKMNVSFASFVKEIKDSLHSVVHGDRDCSYRNVASDSNGKKYFAAGPNPHNIEATARISILAAALTSYLIQEIVLSFPNVDGRVRFTKS